MITKPVWKVKEIGMAEEFGNCRKFDQLFAVGLIPMEHTK